MEDNILNLIKLSKQFPGVKAVDSVSLTIKRGLTHALLGENGAGKSTLIKMITGVYQPTDGTVLLNGKESVFHTPFDAFRKGISVMHQETSLVPQLTVLQNVYLGHEMYNRAPFKMFDERSMRKDLMRLSKTVGIELDPHQKVKELNVAQQKLVEIMKALAHKASIIIMDEPTDSLSAEEIKKLFDIIKDLKEHNVTIIYITHYLDEVFKIADMATVLRDGKHISTRPITELTQEEIVTMMVGRKLERNPVPEQLFHSNAAPALEVSGVTVKNKIEDISFTAHYGEVVGITGVIGAGKTELARALFGTEKLIQGEVRVNGEKTYCTSTRHAVRLGLGMMPEDRKNHGLILKHETYKNMSLAFLKKLCRGGIIQRRLEMKLCAEYRSSLNIKVEDLSVPTLSLSGGNQQKVVIAKWLMSDPDIIIMDEPTRGIDVGSKQEIFKIIRDLADKGKCVVFLSSEVGEVLEVAHRILVMSKGRLVTEIPEDSREHQKILQTMLQGEY